MTRATDHGTSYRIAPNAFVTLDYTLHDEAGELLDASEGDDGEPIKYVHGYGMLVPGLESALIGLKVGEVKKVVVPSDEGFGEYDDELLLEVERGEFPNPEAVAVGDEFVAESPEGDAVPMRVVEVTDSAVIVDANHPLAGIALHYAVTVRDVRPATEEEIRSAAAELEQLEGGEGAENGGPQKAAGGEDVVTIGNKPKLPN